MCYFQESCQYFSNCLYKSAELTVKHCLHARHGSHGKVGLIHGSQKTMQDDMFIQLL